MGGDGEAAILFAQESNSTDNVPFNRVSQKTLINYTTHWQRFLLFLLPAVQPGNQDWINPPEATQSSYAYRTRQRHDLNKEDLERISQYDWYSCCSLYLIYRTIALPGNCIHLYSRRNTSPFRQGQRQSSSPGKGLRLVTGEALCDIPHGSKQNYHGPPLWFSRSRYNCCHWLSRRFDLFRKHVLLYLFDADDFWYRFEWQLGGSGHTHGFLWSSAAPYPNPSEQRLREVFAAYWAAFVKALNPDKTRLLIFPVLQLLAMKTSSTLSTSLLPALIDSSATAVRSPTVWESRRTLIKPAADFTIQREGGRLRYQASRCVGEPNSLRAYNGSFHVLPWSESLFYFSFLSLPFSNSQIRAALFSACLHGSAWTSIKIFRWWESQDCTSVAAEGEISKRAKTVWTSDCEGAFSLW